MTNLARLRRLVCRKEWSLLLKELLLGIVLGQTEERALRVERSSEILHQLRHTNLSKWELG